MIAPLSVMQGVGTVTHAPVDEHCVPGGHEAPCVRQPIIELIKQLPLTHVVPEGQALVDEQPPVIVAAVVCIESTHTPFGEHV